jgi:hypothetical protein
VRRDMPPADPRTNPCSAFRTAFIGNDAAPENGNSAAAAAAATFFDALRPAVKDLPCCRVYNMDEFFVLQAPSGRWTYQRRIAGVPVDTLRGSKLGFSAAVCSAADGSVLSIAVCQKGATQQVHVEIDDDLLTQYHRAESHFFSADKCGEWLGGVATGRGYTRPRCFHSATSGVQAG